MSLGAPPLPLQIGAAKQQKDPSHGLMQPVGSPNSGSFEARAPRGDVLVKAGEGVHVAHARIPRRS
jgi:hypothetical protein